jgi:hypothetical protein
VDAERLNALSHPKVKKGVTRHSEREQRLSARGRE